jgi:uncharacterized membrane protein
MTPLAKRLSIVLAVSIALNLLLGGIMLGRALHRPHPPPRAEREAPAFRHEREGKRAAARGLFREQSEALRDKRTAIGEARRTAQTALESEPFDRAALERALESLRKETAASQEIVHKAIVEAASKGSADERKELGRALEHAGPGGDGRRGPRPKREH